jgi:hypothetical protein
LSFEGEAKKVWVKTSSSTNIFCCCAACTLFPEMLIYLPILCACIIPSFFVDCCQAAINNDTSLNMIMLEKKLLHVNDEVIISNEFTAEELFEIQYRRGSLFKFLFDREHYHHQVSSNLIDPESRAANEKIHLHYSAGTKGKIVEITLKGNVHVEFESRYYHQYY